MITGTPILILAHLVNQIATQTEYGCIYVDHPSTQNQDSSSSSEISDSVVAKAAIYGVVFVLFVIIAIVKSISGGRSKRSKSTNSLQSYSNPSINSYNEYQTGMYQENLFTNNFQQGTDTAQIAGNNQAYSNNQYSQNTGYTQNGIGTYSGQTLPPPPSGPPPVIPSGPSKHLNQNTMIEDISGCNGMHIEMVYQWLQWNSPSSSVQTSSEDFGLEELAFKETIRVDECFRERFQNYLVKNLESIEQIV